MKRILFSTLFVLSLSALTGCVFRFTEPGIYETTPQCYRNEFGQVWCENTLLFAPAPSVEYFIGNSYYHNRPNYKKPRGVWYPWGNMKNDGKHGHHDTRDGRTGGGRR
ncbi:MAG: hypothetical protein PHP62_03330 [Candidatus Moranbacteria bacterium]|nr:hypothetical protein [Candidatus Moranbacteria bacterium]